RPQMGAGRRHARPAPPAAGAAPDRIAFAPEADPGPPLASGLIGVPGKLRRAPSPAPRAATRPKPVPGPRLPADPDLPPDHPLEPGSGPPRVRAAGIAAATIAAADRIAVSERRGRAAKAGGPGGGGSQSGAL